MSSIVEATNIVYKTIQLFYGHLREIYGINVSLINKETVFMMVKDSVSEDDIVYDDKYNIDTLILRYNSYKKTYIEVNELKKIGLPIRHQNPPEDITENMVKFIIRKYDNDNTIVWSKGVDKKYKLTGDLYSKKYKKTHQPEVKSFTSNGPSQFGPCKKFGVLFFLDLREWLNDRIILWRVNLTSDSPEFKSIKMNKTQTHETQCEMGRRPHIGWDKLYPQINDFCVKIYDGTFENIIN